MSLSLFSPSCSGRRPPDHNHLRWNIRRIRPHTENLIQKSPPNQELAGFPGEGEFLGFACGGARVFARACLKNHICCICTPEKPDTSSSSSETLNMFRSSFVLNLPSPASRVSRYSCGDGARVSTKGFRSSNRDLETIVCLHQRRRHHHYSRQRGGFENPPSACRLRQPLSGNPKRH